MLNRRFIALGVIGTLLLSGCGTADPLSDDSKASEVITIGSQDYYSNEIIAEIYAQALEAGGYTVDRQFRIGQREVYVSELEAGNLDLFPEYTGNLLQYLNPATQTRAADEVYAELQGSLPDGLRLLDQSSATDQDSYVVTAEFAAQWGIDAIEDLATVSTPITLGGNSELETRPYGPEGLRQSYGVEVSFTPIEDSGGPLTVKALRQGDIQLANIYSASPALAAGDLVVLNDPQALFLSSHVVPIASEQVDQGAATIINQVSAAMSPEELVALNLRSTEEQLSASAIATDWLKTEGLG